MKHRIFEPVLFQLLHGQSLEQFLMSQEIVFKRGDKQTLAEPPWTTQEIDLTGCDQLVDQSCLIYIDVTLVTNLVKTLDADRIFHCFTSFLLSVGQM